MNDHFGAIIHKDRMRTLYAEAERSRLLASRPRNTAHGSRIAAVLASTAALADRMPLRVRALVIAATVLALLMSGMAGHVWAATTP